LEIDVVAESASGDALLIGEVKWTAPDDPARTLHELERKAAQLPFVEGREVFLALWLKEPVQGSLSPQVMVPQQVLDGLR
jgi:hypothetical protein